MTSENKDAMSKVDYTETLGFKVDIHLNSI